MKTIDDENIFFKNLNHLRKLKEHGSLENLEFKYLKTTESCIEDASDADLSISIVKLVLPILIQCFRVISSVILVPCESCKQFLCK